MSRWIIVLLAGCALCASAQQADPAALLARVRSQVLANAKAIPRYVCRQELVRETYAPRQKQRRACGTLPDENPQAPPKPESALTFESAKPGYLLISSDRAKLDVMIAGGTELFSWPGGGKFQTNDPDELLGGGFAGSGDFASFLTTAFAAGQTTFEYLGTCGSPSCVRYRYDVPVAVSRYVVENPIERVALGYHGTFDVDSGSAKLLAATVVPTDLTGHMRNACDMRTRMTYDQTSRFSIPDSVEKEFLDPNGWYASNSIHYAGCREYGAESTLTFGDDARTADGGTPRKPVALPRPGTALDLRLVTKLDSEVDSAGDSVEAALIRPVRAADGSIIPVGTVVRGHLAQVERTSFPKPSVRLAIRFDTIMTGGTPTPLALTPTGTMDGRGHGVFTFPRNRVVLDGGFVSRWRVR